MPSALMLDHPEQMQAVRMTGVERQNLAINRFRLGQSSGAVVRESFLQRVVDRVKAATESHS